MLVLTRKVGEEIVIGDEVRVRIGAIRGGRIELQVDAPREVSVHRAEVAKRISGSLEPPLALSPA